MGDRAGECLFDRVGDYQQALCTAYYPMTLRQVGSQPFHAAVATYRLGDIALSRAWSSGPFEAEHNAVPLPREQSRLVLFLHEDGSDIVMEGTRRVVSTPGVMMLLDSSHGLRSEQREAATALSLALPSSLAVSALPALSDALLRPLPAESGIAAILADFARSLWRQRDSVHDVDMPAYALALVRMIGSAFRDVGSGEGDNSPATARHFQAMRRVIAAEIANPALSIRLVGERLGFSASYLQLILRRNGASFRRLVLEQRLELCRNALSDPNLAHQSVSTIAFDAGFQELSHFSRRFAEHFGQPPREYRRQRIAMLTSGSDALN